MDSPDESESKRHRSNSPEPAWNMATYNADAPAVPDAYPAILEPVLPVPEILGPVVETASLEGLPDATPAFVPELATITGDDANLPIQEATGVPKNGVGDGPVESGGEDHEINGLGPLYPEPTEHDALPRAPSPELPPLQPLKPEPETQQYQQPQLPPTHPPLYPVIPSQERVTPVAPPAQAVQQEQSQVQLAPSSAPALDPSLVQDQLKYCSTALKSIKRLKDARPFQIPVDPIALNIPNYRNIIKNPMDLSTMEAKLRDQRYANAQEFIADFKLMVENCYTFNTQASPVGQNGTALEKSFTKLMEKMPLQPKASKNKKRQSVIDHPPPVYPHQQQLRSPSGSLPDSRPKREIHAPIKDIPTAAGSLSHRGSHSKTQMSDQDRRFCGEVIRELLKKQHATYAWPFLQPVDPVKLGIPHYRDIIKNPMDLSTLKQKLDAGDYDSAEDFHADASLIFANCRQFNPVGTEIHGFGIKLEQVLEDKWRTKGTAATSPAPNRSQRASKAKIKTPAHMHHDYTSSDEDDDDDSDTRQQLELLQQQLSAITSQMSMLQEKRERKKKKRKSMSSASHNLPPLKHAKSGGSSSRKSTGGGKDRGGGGGTGAGSGTAKQPRKPKRERDEENLPELSYEQKEELSILVSELGADRADKIDKVMEIIRAGSGLPETSDQNEIELDIESLGKSTLWKLYNFVKGKPRAPYGSKVKEKAAKLKAKQQQQQLQHQQQHGGGNGHHHQHHHRSQHGGPVNLGRNSDSSGSESGSESGDSDSN
ncbi:hypothetical protein HKX48_007722 [Thoreauomyces humboldtii]|nr:hypothetical protein HKX48_007722 [Thoreauomyces humboldtii]